MHDRFKFRVWDKGEKSYIEGLDIVRLTQYGAFVFNNAENNTEPSLNPNRFTFEQCTGLKDKNGKLIYEGDIIKIPDNWDEYGFMAGEKREVYFLAGGFRLKPKYNKNDRGCWLEDTDDFEIIGNIHTDKNLLDFS